MAKKNPPGQTAFRQAMNLIGELIFERGRRGDLDLSVSCRRIGDATTIAVYYPDGVMNFVFTDAERDKDLTPGQRAARKLLDGDPDALEG